MARRGLQFITVVSVIFIAAHAGGDPPYSPGTAFTFQGRLFVDQGTGEVPANEVYDFEFKLYDDEVAGSQVGGTLEEADVSVEHGLFKVELDFGELIFANHARWLEIGIRPGASADPYTILAPRQELTPAPFALALPGVWTQQAGNSTLNVIAGHSGNAVSPDTIEPVAGATIGGGGTPSTPDELHLVTDNFGTISGGKGNQAGDGDDVRSNAEYATVSGGDYNQATAQNATVPGGSGNIAGGRYSFAAGRNAKIRSGAEIDPGNPTHPGDQGTFVWADSNDVVFESTGPNQFLIQVAGGVGINTNNPQGYDLNVNGTINADEVLVAGTPVGEGTIGGSGTAGTLPKFTDATTLSDSVIYESAGGDIGIGVPVPGAKLDVDGTVRATGFAMPTGAQDGYVLTSDATGDAAWQQQGGFELPYVGSDDTTNLTLSISNTRAIGGTAIRGEASSGLGPIKAVKESRAGAIGVNGVATTADSVTAIGVDSSATTTADGAAMGVRGSASTDGTGIAYAVYGNASTSGSGTAYGGYFLGYGHFSGYVGIGTDSPSENLVVGEDFGDDAGGNRITIGDSTTGTKPGLVVGEDEPNRGWLVWNVDDDIVELGTKVGGTYYSNTLVLDDGNVGIGETAPASKLHVNGTTTTCALTITGGCDLAEPFAVNQSGSTVERVKPGMVVVIDPMHAGQLKLTNEPYDHKVAGIISGANGLNPGMVMKAEGAELLAGEHPVALTGRVWCWCDASHGPIKPGDLLTTSNTAGHAMKAIDHTRAQGAVLGKAMTPLANGRGLVLVLVSLQ